jgi:protease I
MMERKAVHLQSHNRIWFQVKWLGPLVTIALLLTLLPADAYSQTKKDGSDSLIVMVVAHGDFTDSEYFETRRVFDQHKAKVAVAGVAKGFATSHEGVNIKVDIAIGKLDPDQFGAIVIVGGMGAISSLSMAPVVLAKAGLLRNRQATCFSAEPILTGRMLPLLLVKR